MFNNWILGDIVYESYGFDTMYGMHQMVGHASNRYDNNEFMTAMIVTVVILVVLLFILNIIIKNKKAKIIVNCVLIAFGIFFVQNRLLVFSDFKAKIELEKDKPYTGYNTRLSYNNRFIYFEGNSQSGSIVNAFIKTIEEQNTQTKANGDVFPIIIVHKPDIISAAKKYTIGDFKYDDQGYFCECTITEN